MSFKFNDLRGQRMRMMLSLYTDNVLKIIIRNFQARHCCLYNSDDNLKWKRSLISLKTYLESLVSNLPAKMEVLKRSKISL